jgi:glutathione S-transferase
MGQLKGVQGRVRCPPFAGHLDRRCPVCNRSPQAAERSRPFRNLSKSAISMANTSLFQRQIAERAGLTVLVLETFLMTSKRDAIRLYVDSQFASPYAMVAFVALREKGIPFEIETINLGANENQRPAFSGISVTRRVPTLVHGDFSLSESSAICEYIDETFPGVPLYPRDNRARGRARQIQAWLRSDLMPIRVERPTLGIFYRPNAAPLTDEAKAAVSKLFDAAHTLLDGSEKGLFDQWCIADVDLAIMLNRLVINGDKVPDVLVRYANRQWQRPTVEEWVKKVRPALE